MFILTILKMIIFREGLISFSIGMSIYLNHNAVSTTMAHLLTDQHRSRFIFSRKFYDLLVGQMKNTLEGKKPGEFVLRHRNRGQNEENDMWPDCSVNDCICNPDCLEDIFFYQFAKSYDRIAFNF